VYLGSNAHPDAARVAGLARRVRNLGAASLDLCLVARGAADLYYMHSAVANTKLRAVDIAAGTLIVREAGGFVLDLGGRDLDLPLEAKARTDLVAVGDRRAWEAIRGRSASPRIRTSRARWTPRNTSWRGSSRPTR